LGQKTGENPIDIARMLKESIASHESVSAVEVAGLGFLNFFLSAKYLLTELSRIGKEKERYGMGLSSKNKKVMVEFTDPNPFKEFHIGHLYSNVVGESLCRLFESQGAEVKRVNYQGDVGLHVAKALWGMVRQLKEQGISLSDIEKKEPSERMKFLGTSYTLGDKAYTKGTAKEEIEELNAKIFDHEASIQELYEKGRAWSLEYFETLYKKLGTKFDRYYFESEVAETGKKIVEEGLKNGVFKESEGAIIFPGEKVGLHSRVFINSKGLPTYEAKELGLAPIKYKDFKYDVSLIVTANEIIEYFRVLLVVLKELNPELAEKTRHVSHGMVRRPEGKMSSRTGNVVTAEQLIAEVKSHVAKIMKTSGSEVPETEQEETAETIAIGAIKYSLLRVGVGKDISFDIAKSLSLEGESGPYLQYTYARCQSILRQAKLNSIKFKLNGVKLSAEEEGVLRLLYRFPEVARDAANNLSPNLISSYAFDVAKAYNLFYNKHRVLQADTTEEREFRVALTTAVSVVLKNSLSLLGIQTLEKM